MAIEVLPPAEVILFLFLYNANHKISELLEYIFCHLYMDISQLDQFKIRDLCFWLFPSAIYSLFCPDLAKMLYVNYAAYKLEESFCLLY